MKKEGLFIFAILFFLAVFPLISAQGTEEENVERGYSCLEGLIEQKNCSRLTFDEKIFSVLSTGECYDELMQEENEIRGCFPRSSCRIKQTALASLALRKGGVNTEKYENYLTSNNKSPEDLEWYLQIESKEATICSIKSNTKQTQVELNEDKTVASVSQGCFEISQNGYWLSISPLCYKESFEVSCDKSFSTNLLFRKKESERTYVLSETHSSAEGGTTNEKINSLCFLKGTECDYEGGLWGATFLVSKGYDISPFLPYLIVMSDEPENQRFLPEGFLYTLINDENYLISVLEKQKEGSYWEVSGDRYYDSAVAMYTLGTDIDQSGTKDWLFEKQQQNGCWNNNHLVDTAFLLSSLWPRSIILSGGNVDPGNNGGNTDNNCNEVGFCTGVSQCSLAGGVEIQSRSNSCPGIQICCDKEPVEETCSQRGGLTCGVSQVCSISTVITSDTNNCCLGICEEPSQQPVEELCSENQGVCRANCNSFETEDTNLKCEFFGEVCCLSGGNNGTIEPKKSSKGMIIIIVLVVLIILVGLAIYQKEKLKKLFTKRKDESKGFENNQHIRQTPQPRQYIPSQRKQEQFPRPQNNSQMIHKKNYMENSLQKKGKDEMDEVIKKLKRMSEE